MGQDSPDQCLTVGFGNDPIEEVAFGGAENSGRFECGSRKHVSRVVIAKAKNRERDRLRNDHKKSVLKEQRVAFNFPAIDQLQKLRPQLSLQGDGRIALHSVPNRSQPVVSAPERHQNRDLVRSGL